MPPIIPIIISHKMKSPRRELNQALSASAWPSAARPLDSSGAYRAFSIPKRDRCAATSTKQQRLVCGARQIVCAAYSEYDPYAAHRQHYAALRITTRRIRVGTGRLAHIWIGWSSGSHAITTTPNARQATSMGGGAALCVRKIRTRRNTKTITSPHTNGRCARRLFRFPLLES